MIDSKISIVSKRLKEDTYAEMICFSTIMKVNSLAIACTSLKPQPAPRWRRDPEHGTRETGTARPGKSRVVREIPL